MNEAQFLKDRIKLWRNWFVHELAGWLKWSTFNAIVVRLVDGNKISGVAIGRRIEAEHYRHLRLCHQPTGKILWVDALACEKKSGMRQMLESVLAKNKGISQIGFSRQNKKGNFKVYDIEKFMRRIQYAG